ncbi:STAS domain-containing protein [Amycolatopsis sp. NBC_01286]|uniref:STAS domain-containing protein n=1 Tax=Amycolatopsis sp. NBC_01286 TaxID=2903560 RepID=UPI002E104593|nr:STAS domain-containing protein [Amycolatopsis sp. NBC_01286]
MLVTVRGDLDTATAPYLGARLDDRLRAHPRRVDVDLSEVDFLGVADLRVLTRAEQTGARLGRLPRQGR